MGSAENTSEGSIGAVLETLWATIEDRRGGGDPETSYTTRLLYGHEDKLLKKIGEEATEVVMAAKDDDNVAICYESADLVYHLLVVLARHGLALDDLAEELASRFK